MVAPVSSSHGCASLCADPHLALAHGGRADFRGRSGALYNFVSSQSAHMNVKTEDATFRLGELTVHGSFMTEIHVVARAGDRLLNVSYWGSELNDNGWGWRMVTGSCGGAAFTMWPHTTRDCAGSKVSIDMATVTIDVPEWTFTIQNRPVYKRISGPKHRLDMAAQPKVDDADFAVQPHGIIGQSFDGDGRPRFGKLDQYPPRNVAREFTTTAMAEGAIDGVAAHYEVRGPYAVDGQFSRFGAPSRPRAKSRVARRAMTLRVARATDDDTPLTMRRKMSECTLYCAAPTDTFWPRTCQTQFDAGFPRCYSTFANLSAQYTSNDPSSYLPAVTGYVTRPYSEHSSAECASIPFPTALLVPHASPLGVWRFNQSLSPSFPVSYDDKLLISAAGSWNRAAGTYTGYVWDMATVSNHSGSCLQDGTEVSSGQHLYITDYQHFVPSNTSLYRPSDIHQTEDGRVLGIAKYFGDPGSMNGIVEFTYSSGAVSVTELISIYGARRIVSDDTYLYVSIMGNPWEESGLYDLEGKAQTISSGIVAVRKNDTTLKDVVSCYSTDGLALTSNGRLYYATARSVEGVALGGNRVLYIDNIKSIVDQIFAGSLPSGDPMLYFENGAPTDSHQKVAHQFLYFNGHHADYDIALSPGETHLLVGRGAACNIGCRAWVDALDLSTFVIYEFAIGFRNPLGIRAWDDDFIIVADMGSDLGEGIADVRFQTGGHESDPLADVGGQEGPNDRIFAVPWDPASLTTPRVEVCMDDFDGKIAQYNSTHTCAQLVALYGCEGTIPWTAMAAIWGDFAQISLNAHCHASCGHCPSPPAPPSPPPYSPGMAPRPPPPSPPSPPGEPPSPAAPPLSPPAATCSACEAAIVGYTDDEGVSYMCDNAYGPSYFCSVVPAFATNCPCACGTGCNACELSTEVDVWTDFGQSGYMAFCNGTSTSATAEEPFVVSDACSYSAPFQTACPCVCAEYA